MTVRTGYYGIPGGTERQTTQIHIDIDGKPACGTYIGLKNEFQFCSQGIHEPYIECKRCKNWLKKETSK